MIKEYSLHYRIKYELNCNNPNFKNILNLLMVFLRIYRKNETALLHVSKIKCKIDQLSELISILKEDDLIKLIEYCEKYHLGKLSKTLCNVILIDEKIKLKYILYNKTHTNDSIIFEQANILIQKHVKEIFNSCFKKSKVRKELITIFQQTDDRESVYAFFKNKLVTLNGIIFIGILAFSLSYISILISLEHMHIDWLTNYIDIVSLAFRAKIFYLFIIVLIIVYFFIVSTPINQVLLEQRLSRNEKIFGIFSIIKIDLLATPILVNKLSWWTAILASFIILFVSLIEYLYFYRSKLLTLNKYAGVLAGQFVVLIYSIIFIPVSYLCFEVNESNFHNVILLSIVLYNVYILVHIYEVSQYKNTLNYILGRIIILFIFISLAISWFLQTTWLFPLIDAGFRPDTFLLVNIETDSQDLANRFRHAGLLEVKYNSTSDIYENKIRFESSILNMSLSEHSVCNTNFQRSIFSTMQNSINQASESQIYTELQCITAFHKINHAKIQSRKWLIPFFSVYKKSETKYNYWIYGVNIPFFIPGKVIHLTREDTRFRYTLTAINGLYYFDINNQVRYTDPKSESNMIILRDAFTQDE